LNDQASKFVRGQLFINGHSFAIPWDTHKREYLADHPIAEWVKKQVQPIIKGYMGIARRFAGDTELRKKVLATSRPEVQSKATIVRIPSGQELPDKLLPKWEYKNSTSKAKVGPSPSPRPNAVKSNQEDSNARLAEATNGERVVSIALPSADYEELIERFGAATSEELETVVRECLTGGVAFTLTPEQLATALKVFDSTDVGELSDLVRSQLLKKLKS
jgi:hypothetical protein